MTQNSQQQRHGWPTTGDLESNSLSAFPTIPDQNLKFPYLKRQLPSHYLNVCEEPLSSRATTDMKGTSVTARFIDWRDMP